MPDSSKPVVHRRVDWGDLRRLTPFSDVWGHDRGRPIDRYYIENFLEQHRGDIRGRVLEVQSGVYTHRYNSGVTQSDILDIDGSNPDATVIADLGRESSLPAETFDCFVFTQTLHIIYDVGAVLSNISRALKPGGVLLCTVPAVSRVNYENGGLESGDFWRFTGAALRRLFAQHFAGSVAVEGYGNVMVCAAFLYGLAVEELTNEELDSVDPWFPLLFSIRAVKARPSDD